MPLEHRENRAPVHGKAFACLQSDEREFLMRASGELRVLAVDVLVAVFPVVAGFGLYFLLRLLSV
jgi:hypothetical protein